MTTCSNCKYLADPEMESVCVNDAGPNWNVFVLPNDSCSKFENINILKTGERWECV